MGHGHVFVTPGTEDGRAGGQIADEAIGLYLEYRYTHGYSEAAARAAAVAEISEGVSAEDDEDTRGEADMHETARR